MARSRQLAGGKKVGKKSTTKPQKKPVIIKKSNPKGKNQRKQSTYDLMTAEDICRIRVVNKATGRRLRLRSGIYGANSGYVVALQDMTLAFIRELASRLMQRIHCTNSKRKTVNEEDVRTCLTKMGMKIYAQ